MCKYRAYVDNYRAYQYYRGDKYTQTERDVMPKTETSKAVKRLNATLPAPLANFVGEITGDGGLYETPSEFIRDLIRRYMENVQQTEYKEINSLLMESIAEDDYSAWTGEDLQDIRQAIKG